MHLPEGFVCGEVNAAAFALSAGACTWAAWRSGRALGDREIPLLGTTAAFVFAAQMLNFPVACGTSGHFVGALLAAVLVGPGGACLVMAVVLALQCLLFADGGLTALGSNVLNMGVVGGIGAYGLFALLRAVLPKNRAGFMAAAAFAAWASVVGSAALCAVELGVSGTVPLTVALPAMAAVHAIIGVGEALITVATLSAVLAARPDLVVAWHGRREMSRLQEA
jgi:cobalt/nickel transport system permease protein